ncbi:MAG: helix-turn-helix transcriptional regulator [Gemmatimonadaceae bacterium]|nr:helix-turn-helix transcriptional regulator [Gemmatimonadaceae bacterium]
MSISRQPSGRSAPERIAVRTAAVGFSSGYRWAGRHVDWGQLLWASQGAITATIEGALWIVPTGRALWLPPGTPNDVTLIGRGVLRTVYLTRTRSRAIAKTPRLVAFPPLLRELLRRAIERDTLTSAIASDTHVIALLVDELAAACAAPSLPVDLPLPRDPRAERAASRILMAPGTPLAALHLERHSGAARRTLERLFHADTGLSLGAWHQRANIIHSISRLAQGDNVAQAGIAAGYSSTSAFIHAFKSVTGTTPGKPTSGAFRTDHAENRGKGEIEPRRV